MQDWKLQDKIRDAWTKASGNLDETAKLLNMSPSLLQRRIKKWGLQLEPVSPE